MDCFVRLEVNPGAGWIFDFPFLVVQHMTDGRGNEVAWVLFGTIVVVVFEVPEDKFSEF